MTNTLISAIDLAAIIIPEIGDNENRPMTLRKLQKLVYYCQAWSLALEGVPLFQEDILACKCCGPVVAELQEYAVSQFAKVPQKKKGVYEVFNTDMDLFLNSLGKNPSKLSSYQEKTVMRVLTKYEPYGTTFLEGFSKEEGPFKKAMLRSKDGDKPPVIELESMRRYYTAVEKVRRGSPYKEFGGCDFILDIPAWQEEGIHEK